MRSGNGGVASRGARSQAEIGRFLIGLERVTGRRGRASGVGWEESEGVGVDRFGEELWNGVVMALADLMGIMREAECDGEGTGC